MRHSPDKTGLFETPTLSDARSQIKRWITYQRLCSQRNFTATDENYFVVTAIDSVAVSSDEVHGVLTSICSNTLAEKYAADVTDKITYFATSHSYGYEYPALSEVESLAIKVPALPAESLEEEVIISFKGTCNGGDVLQDIELMLANLTETDEDWQIDAYNFTQRLMQGLEQGF